MRGPITLLLATTVLLLASSAAQARVSHGDSGILSIDTMTAVDDAAGPPPATTADVAPAIPMEDE